MPALVTGMDFDENSIVDEPANQLGRILLTKSASGSRGGTVPKRQSTPAEDLQFEEVDVDQLEPGDIVEVDGGYAEIGDDGQLYEVTDQDLAELSTASPEDFGAAPVEDLEPVGKSASFLDTVTASLSKALREGDRDEVIKNVARQIDSLAQRAERAESIAKSVQDRVLLEKYVARADSYGLPVDAQRLGSVMKRVAEALPHDDAVFLHRTFEAAGQAASAAFEEIGKGAGSNLDPFGVISAITEGTVDLSKADDVEQFFLDNPEAYDEYERTRLGL